MLAMFVEGFGGEVVRVWAKWVRWEWRLWAEMSRAQSAFGDSSYSIALSS
jgi:hypothetical protein